MKKVLLIVVVLALGAGGVVAYRGYELLRTFGCIGNCNNGNGGATAVRGSGRIVTEARTVGPFTSIHLGGIGSASIARTGTTGLSISADDNLIPLIMSEVKDGALYLSIKNAVSIRAGHVEYRVTVGDLREVDVSGAADLQAADLAGAALAVTVSGAGQARLSGRTDDLTAGVSGAGSLDAAALDAKRATIAASGSGSVLVNASDMLDASASGAGNVRYLGGPKLATHVSGAGSVRQARQ
jgi:hypothetical protein